MARSALVVGAGIGGLAAALSLRRAGWSVTVFERAAEPRELGYGLGLFANAVRALRALGVVDAIMARGVTPSSAEVRHADGRVIRTLKPPIRASGPGADAPIIVMRPVLHDVLLDAFGRDGLRLGAEATGFRVVERHVILTLADGSTASGDVLVGADGVGSIVRSTLHPVEPPPRSSGYFAIRGASPAVEALGNLDAIIYLGTGVESGIVRASRTTVYWYLSLLAGNVGSGPHDVCSVVRQSTLHFDSAFHAIIDPTPPANMRIDELLERELLDRWGAGPVTLLGDAAHPMLPHTGQGAAQALEDAVCLGDMLGAGGDATVALRRYERARSRRTRRVVNMGPRIARVTTTRNALIGRLRNAAIRLVPERAVARAFTAGGPRARRP